MSNPLTPEQLYQYQLHARITFLELTVQQMLKMMATQSAQEPKQALAEWANLVRLKTDGLHFRNADAAVSDMLAAEFQEAVDRFLRQLLE
jgi:hypothetical protein